MKLKVDSIKWAINNNYQHGDTDLFPRPIEFDIINSLGQEAIDKIKNIDIGSHQIGAMRRFLIPKDELSHRNATQFDPLDSIIITAIVYEFGQLIEDKRIPISQNSVYSYRFSPSPDYSLYNKKVTWLDFWQQCKDLSSQYPYVLSVDISDFYNQIYHHTIENQLNDVGFPNEINKWIMKLFKKASAMVSRGIPVGPHSTHLFAEMCLIPIDDNLNARNIVFCRYVDDYMIFCKDYDVARIVNYQFADILDSYKLVVQRSKINIWEANSFQVHCNAMLVDKPINDYEKEIIHIIKSHSQEGPYALIKITNLSDEEIKYFDKTIVEKIIDAYVNAKEPNYTRLRWFIRRLSQVQHACAVDYFIEHLDALTPVISDISHYLISVKDTYDGEWNETGKHILRLLDHPIIKSNPYFQISLLNLFWVNINLNNLSSLIARYKTADGNVKRKILLAAHQPSAKSWITQLKVDYDTLDVWSKRAFLVSSNALPADERKHFINNMVKHNSILEEILVIWAKK